MKKLLTYTLISLMYTTSPTLPASHSLYKVEKSPFANNVARNVGDIITIKLEGESLKVESKEKQTINKDNSASLSISGLPLFPALKGIYEKIFGKNSDGNSTYPKTNYDEKAAKQGDGSLENSYELSEGSVQGRIVEVVNDNQLVIKGQRSISINGKEKTIYINGVIRRDDIDGKNVVQSDKIADATLEIDGEMVAKDLQPGVFSKLIRALF